MTSVVHVICIVAHIAIVNSFVSKADAVQMLLGNKQYALARVRSEKGVLLERSAMRAQS